MEIWRKLSYDALPRFICFSFPYIFTLFQFENSLNMKYALYIVAATFKCVTSLNSGCHAGYCSIERLVSLSNK